MRKMGEAAVMGKEMGKVARNGLHGMDFAGWMDMHLTSISTTKRGQLFCSNLLGGDCKD
jgi:hypothetical protein